MNTTPTPPRPARVLVTGATGFVGRQLCLRLAREGFEVQVWTRSATTARAALGQGPQIVEAGEGREALVRALESCDAVVHLAGAGLFDRRWSAARKRELVSSRVDLTRELVNAIGAAKRRPRVLVNASAVGWYGSRGDELLDERSSAGAGFLAELCAGWEREAFAAREHGVRVAVHRIGVVLGLGGGALARMAPPFRFGVGGRLGNGRQWMSWIHAEDLVELLVRSLIDERFDGVFNAVAPEPATNRDLTRELGRALGRATPFPVPAFALRLALGGSSTVLLSSQRVLPRRALELGFEFRHPTLASALSQLLGAAGSVSFERADAPPESAYLDRHPPRYVLRQRTVVPAPLEQVFEFFSRPENLGAITPSSLSFRLLSPAAQPMHNGLELDYAIRVGPVPMRWRSRIEVWKPGAGFVDSQVRGPYSSWWHEHRFERGPDDTTVMHDVIWYAPPLGPIGALAQRLAIAAQLEEVFRYREHAIALRFGRASATAPRRARSRAQEAPSAAAVR